MRATINTVASAAKMILFFTLLTGLVYPFLITGIAQVFFPWEANGSLIIKDGKVIGSKLIGQQFTDSGYFWSRPSATGYGTLPGSGSNLGPTSLELKKKVKERNLAFISFNHLDDKIPVPADMLFASGSGLDPHISQKSAMLQVGRVAKVRAFNAEKTIELRELVQRCTEKPQFSIFGNERVNVFMLNLELDKLK
jgi:potassium-transporting ATPase KdpC subunit